LHRCAIQALPPTGRRAHHSRLVNPYLNGSEGASLSCYVGVVTAGDTWGDGVPNGFPTVYQHPLAYLLGLEGLALLRAFAGEYDREFTEARLLEVSALMDSVLRSDDGGCARALTTAEGYRNWAATYDLQANQLIDQEQPIVRGILDRLPLGTALDAACGTGRHAAYLASLGHKVVGVDSSREMLTAARAKVPQGDFRLADLHYLPLPDNGVDVVVCALALTHVPDLLPVLSEFKRVLRPGGHLVISDSRGFFGAITLPLVKTGPDGRPGYIPNRNRPTSEYLVAALSVGLEVRSCEEPRGPATLVDDDGIPSTASGPAIAHVPGTPPNIWALHSWATAATNAAYRDNPAVIVWHFQTRRS
jgi:SAM-dependent methyltransferase